MNDGVSDGQFVDVSGVSPSNNRSNRNTFSHYSLHHIQLSLIQPWGAREMQNRWWMETLIGNRLTFVSQTKPSERILPMRVDTCVHTTPGLGGRCLATRESEPPLWIIRHTGEFENLCSSVNAQRWIKRLPVSFWPACGEVLLVLQTIFHADV